MSILGQAKENRKMGHGMFVDIPWWAKAALAPVVAYWWLNDLFHTGGRKKDDRKKDDQQPGPPDPQDPTRGGA